MPSLFRRREVVLPTVWGALLLSALVIAVATLTLRHLALYLAPNEPATTQDGGSARTLVVEGWLDEDALDGAVALISRGTYERILVAGGPIDGWRDERRFSTFAERAADYLRRHGVTAIPVVPVPAPASARDRSFFSAVLVRDWLRRHAADTHAIDLYSAGVHARRSRLVYRLAFGPEVGVGVFAATPRSYQLERWWSTSEGAKTTVGELLSLVWTKCCFWPGPSGSREERWAVPKSPA